MIHPWARVAWAARGQGARPGEVATPCTRQKARGFQRKEELFPAGATQDGLVTDTVFEIVSQGKASWPHPNVQAKALRGKRQVRGSFQFVQRDRGEWKGRTAVASTHWGPQGSERELGDQMGGQRAEACSQLWGGATPQGQTFCL